MSVVLVSRRRASPTLLSAVSFVAAVLLHVSLLLGALRLGGSAPRPPATIEIVALPPPAVSPSPEQPPPPPEKPPVAPHPVRAPRVATAKAPAPPPPPAAAARALTQIDDGKEPLDLTDSLVLGTAETYAGKTTAAKGTSTRPGGHGLVSGLASGSSNTATGAGEPGEIDLSKPPRLKEGTSWSCPFPSEADQRGIDEAVVRLALSVDERGRVLDVAIEQDPGDGFGREAVACARSKIFSPSLDRRGTPVAGRTRVDVRFQR